MRLTGDRLACGLEQHPSTLALARSGPAKNHDEIVRRHRYGFGKRQAMFDGQRAHLPEVADAPVGILRAQPGVEVLIAARGMVIVDLERAVQKQKAPGQPSWIRTPTSPTV